MLLAIAALAVVSQVPNQLRIVVDYDATISSEVRSQLLRFGGAEFDSLLASQDLKTSTTLGVLFIHREKTPYQLHVEKSIALLQSIKLGALVETAKLDPATRELLETHLSETFGGAESGSLPGAIELKANSKYVLNVGGRKVSLDIWLQDDGPPPFQRPELSRQPAKIRPVPPAERKKVGLGSAMTFHAGLTRHDADSTAAVAAFTARIAEENALARAAFERAVHPVLEQLGEKNEWVPDGDETLEQLPPEVRERIKDSFLNSYKANGYASREEAEAAWSSAQLSDSFVQFMFNYSVENPDGSTGLRSVELTRTGR